MLPRLHGRWARSPLKASPWTSFLIFSAVTRYNAKVGCSTTSSAPLATALSSAASIGLFAGPLPCVLSIQDDDQPKRYLVNSMCAMSAEELNAAQSPSALWDAMRAHPADAERIFFDAGPEWQRKKESSIHRAREAPLDADLAAAAIDKFGPYLCRMQLSDELVCNGRWELYTMSVYGCATHRGRRHVFCMTFLRVKSKGAAKRRKIETKTGTVGSTSASASLGHDTEYLSEENLRSLVEDLHGSGQADDLLDEFMAAMSDDFAPGEAETDETERRGLE